MYHEFEFFLFPGTEKGRKSRSQKPEGVLAAKLSRD